MIDPPRLRDAAGGDVGEMLSAARADGPRDGASDKRRVLAALAALEGTGTPGTAASEVDTSPSSRWVLGALAGAGLAMIGAIGAVSMTSSQPPPHVGASQSAPAALPPAEVPASTAESPEPPAAAIPSVDVVDLPAAASSSGSRHAESAAKSKDVASSSAPTTTTGDELAVVERVRSRLATGDVKGARENLAAYRAAFVRGRFVEEVDALEVEVLAADGARAEAVAKADAFTSRYPRSPYARRVRSVVSFDQAGTP